jgi:thioredoxin 1
MQTLTAETFKEKVFNFEASKDFKFEGQKPAIIDFYADWCGPCKALSPILEEIAKEYQGQVDVYKVNTEATPEIAAMFGVRGIPSLLFIPKAGQPAMTTGLVPKASLKKAISDIFKINQPAGG